MEHEGGITASHCARIEEEGYTIIDDFLNESIILSLLKDIQKVQSDGRLKANTTHFTLANGKSTFFNKPYIQEGDLHNHEIRPYVPNIQKLFTSKRIVKMLQHNLPHYGLQDDGRALKMQYNGGKGGCFPYHYDNPGRPNKRKLTCLLYMNLKWKVEDGGELELQPFLRPCVKIPPLFNRMVIFKSDLILHRVLPAWKERYCLTIWIDGEPVNTDNETLLKMNHVRNFPSFAQQIQKSPLQRVVSRAVYAKEYRLSLQDMGAANEEDSSFADLIESHDKYVSSIEKNPVMHQIVTALRNIRQDF